MTKFCFTGNPFVDAGIAGMCAAANIQSLSALSTEAVDEAVSKLLDVIGSDAAFKKRRINDKKETAFATSEMTVIFPNGPLSQSSYPTVARKLEEYKKRVNKKHEAFKQLAAGQTEVSGYGVCFVDGSTAFARVGNDEFPLVDSKNKRNFHPGLQAGHSIGALTALALEFFPLSVLRTGNNAGFFWFVHTANEKIAIACAELTRDAMVNAKSRKEGLGFFGKWNIPSRDPDASLVALVRDLITTKGQSAITWQEIEEGMLPVTAYVFSNDNRGPNIAAHDLPHQLFRFFDRLRYDQTAFNRFNREVLQSEHIGWLVAKKMLAREQVVTCCGVHPEGEKSGRLRGGWLMHSLYATEVLEMSSAFIRDVETVSERVVSSDDANGLILILKREGASAALLRLRRKDLITFDEYVRFVSPDDRYAAFTARDYLLAAIYERQAATERGEPFTSWSGDEIAAGGAKHPLVLLTERIGEKLAADGDLGKKIAIDLAKTRGIGDLRGALLRPVRHGLLSWNDFISIFPPDDARVSYQMRDYLLAYLYTALRDPNLPEPEAIASKVADETDH